MCNNKVTVDVGRSDVVEITINCGDIYSSGHRTETAQCPACEAAASEQYPQGWRFYPGDICKHGVYVGGDHDCACGQCESE